MKRYKTVIVWIVLLFFLVAVLFYCFIVQDSNCINSVRFMFGPNNDFKDSVYLYENNSVYYAFLPSYAKLNNTVIKCDSGYGIHINDQMFEQDTTCGKLELNKKYKISLENVLGFSVFESDLIILKSANIPALSIQLNDGNIEEINQSADKSIYKSGYCTLTKANSEVNYKGSLSKMKGRGNGTWNDEKKPYNIYFDDAVDLLDMGESNKYCLLANGHDTSNLRNKIVYDVAKEMGLEFSVDSEFVDLYVDSKYLGLYLLTDSVEVGENHVDIVDLYSNTQNVNQFSLSKYETFEEGVASTLLKGKKIPNNPDNISGGYVIETIIPDRVYYCDNVFGLSDSEFFSVKSPKYASKEQMKYISEFFKNAKHSFGNDYTKYIDADSFVKAYLINEVFGNTDSNSLFFYKNNDDINNLLYAGPIWDFDMSLGITYFSPDPNPKSFYINRWGFCNKLYKNASFVADVKKIYKNIMIDIINDIQLNRLKEYKKTINDSYQMNDIVWGNIDNPFYKYGKTFKNLQGHIDYISNYLTLRKEFLDDVWCNNKKICTVYAESPSSVLNERYYYSVEYGDKLKTLPKLECDGYEFLGWYDETGEEFVPNSIIKYNKTYVARWKKEQGNKAGIDTVEQTNQNVDEDFNSMIKDNVLILLVALIVCITLILDSIFVLKKRRRKNEQKH